MKTDDRFRPWPARIRWAIYGAIGFACLLFWAGVVALGGAGFVRAVAS